MNVSEIRDSDKGGWTVTVEIPNGYTRGRSRMVDVFVPADAVAGMSREERLLFVKRRVESRMGDLQGADLDSITETKAVLEARLRERVYDVANLVTVHNEAVALGRPQEEIDKWAQLRNDLYFASLATLDAWSEAT